jgi:hypothetical protein
MVEVSVDLSGLTVLAEQAAENAHAANPVRQKRYRKQQSAMQKRESRSAKTSQTALSWHVAYQMIFWGKRASRVPCRFPVPVCRPLDLARARLFTRAREWMAAGLRIT